jgi:hypothetical protein
MADILHRRFKSFLVLSTAFFTTSELGRLGTAKTSAGLPRRKLGLPQYLQTATTESGVTSSGAPQ